MKGDYVLFFYGFVIGVCVTRIYYEHPPWWAWVVAIVAIPLPLIVMSPWVRRWRRGQA